ncbi:sugar-binding domain-containing protein [Endozoicomonas sp. GU-1]|uniref:glycoside hydrolase family 2 protein n=1 Tax=Endozoicomonas sp. GU-1 TaxID=3009078 RepID=UPI0022B5BD81|nr:sugar-binding domain-containing protein [Endozoicomonas sp. GU-1]WBA80496.1 hypothetical protein O2T12_19475 [Endozoicomonas sp. GU-1]WBA88059.1 hypothetical protein O3276_08670 [Endozoicomonas sp. GU-1]
MKKHHLLIPALSLALIAGCNNDDNEDTSPPVVNPEPGFTSQPRESDLINNDWQFRMDYISPESVISGYDDSSWEQINIPHVWDIDNGQDGGSYFYGQSSYRKNLVIDQLVPDQRYYLEFEGAALISTVYVNGQEVGEHNGGFSTFRFDVTDYLQTGNNQLAIQVDNRLSSMNAAEDNNFGRDTFLPLDAGADFTWWGGIYRDVHLLKLNNVSIDAEDFGGPGVYISQKNVSTASADLTIAVHLSNKSTEDFAGEVLVTIQDPMGNTVKTVRMDAELAAGEKRTITEDMVMDSPTLWHGTKNPYVYQTYTQLIESGVVVDEVKQPLGLRSFEFDPEQGFILNGEPYPLRGVALHQDYIDVGWATTYEQRKESMDLIKEMGANTVRFSHYPHNLDMQDYSDQLGFVNWVEIPMINAASMDPSYEESAKQQITEMVKQAYNNPSVGLWGMTNEISMRNPETPEDTAALIKRLSDHTKSLDGDAYRKTTQAAVFIDPTISPLHEAVEVNAYNRYDGWYVGTTEDFGKFIDQFRKDNPGHIVGVSEYGAGVSPDWHTDTPKANDHTEQFSQLYHESYLQQIEDRDFLWGSHIWNMYDFTAHRRDEGDTKGRNDKGLVTIDRKTKKDAFYLYQAAWSETPMVYIASKKQKETSLSNIKAYSNLDALTLFINDQEISTLNTADNARRVVFEWKNLAELTVGTHKIRVEGGDNGTVVSDTFDLTRVENESNELTSSFISVMSSGEDAGVLTQMPVDLTLGGLKKLVLLPPGATMEIVGKGGDANLVIEPSDEINVTAESGDSRVYKQEQAESLSYGRPVSDNAVKGFYPDVISAWEDTLNLVDGKKRTPWAGFTMDGNTFAEIDLQHSFYVDQVELSQGLMGIGYPGKINFEIGTNILAVDHQDHVKEKEWNKLSQSFKVHKDKKPVEAKYVRITISESSKKITHPSMGHTVELAFFDEITVHGGMIASNSNQVDIDYGRKQITLRRISTNVSDLKESLDTPSGRFELTVIGINGEPVEDGLVIPGHKLKVERITDTARFAEVYTLTQGIPVPPLP